MIAGKLDTTQDIYDALEALNNINTQVVDVNGTYNVEFFDDQTDAIINDSFHDESIYTETNEEIEEIALDANSRLTIKPIENKYEVIWKLYKKQQDSYWRAEEIDFSSDRSDFENVLDDDERHFVKMILAFFAASDGIVNMNLRE